MFKHTIHILEKSKDRGRKTGIHVMQTIKYLDMITVSYLNTLIN